VHPGDGFVLSAVGRGTRVFAVARATSEPYPSDDERFPFRVNVEYLVNRNVDAGVGIRQISDRNLIGPIQRGHSYLRLEQEEYDRAEALLRGATADAS
jgi:hypothetical protein